MAKKKPKFYVVWEGRTPGIYTDWSSCQNQINGYSGARYKSFSTRAAAQDAYGGESYDYIGKGGKKPDKPEQAALFKPTGNPILPSIAVDAACSGNPGDMEFQGVDTETGDLLFHAGPFARATNNVGEFLGLVQGLRTLHEQGSNMPIYTDSKTAMAWVRNKKANTTLERVSANEVVFEMMEDAVAWLKANTYNTKIIKWPTTDWGEIPADFGRK